MALFRYLGGAQQPDLYGYVEPGDVLELDEQPDVGEWERTSSAPSGPPTTPQPPSQPTTPAGSADAPQED